MPMLLDREGRKFLCGLERLHIGNAHQHQDTLGHSRDEISVGEQVAHAGYSVVTTYLPLDTDELAPAPQLRPRSWRCNDHMSLPLEKAHRQRLPMRGCCFVLRQAKLCRSASAGTSLPRALPKAPRHSASPPQALCVCDVMRTQRCVHQERRCRSCFQRRQELRWLIAHRYVEKVLDEKAGSNTTCDLVATCSFEGLTQRLDQRPCVRAVHALPRAHEQRVLN